MQELLRKMKRKRRKHRNLNIVSAILAVLVAGGVFWQLTLPGIAMSADQTYCGKEEHTHTDACKAGRELICSTAETAGHTHGDACYQEKSACGKEEHVHTLACYSDPSADVESQSDWEKTFAEVKLTGNWSEDVIAIAESQLGYTESDRNYSVNEEGKKKGYSRYGAWYGNSYGDWNAMFASFCLHYANVPEEIFPQSASCPQWMEDLQDEECGLYRAKEDTEEAYVPKKGDLVFFAGEDAKSADRVGVLAEIKEETDTEAAQFRVIEGDSDDCVQYVTYEQDDSRILGYGEVPEMELPEMYALDGASGAAGGGSASSTEFSLPHEKTIDAFRDGKDNSDTNVDTSAEDNTDLYRLYLDVVGASKPIDVLLVVDQSSSMASHEVQTADGRITRLLATQNFLNGTENTDGFIKYVLQMNPDNKVAVCTFDGRYSGIGAVQPTRYWRDDAKDYFETQGTWIQNKNSQVTLYAPTDTSRPLENIQSTNYCAGIMRADEMLKKVENDGNKKIMIFLSDGEPTLYLDVNNVEGPVMGSGNDNFRVNVQRSSNAAISLFDKYFPKSRGITVRSIAVDMIGKTEVLNHISGDESGANTIMINGDMSILQEKLEPMFLPANAVITDTLSAYTEVYTTQPDYKVTMTKLDEQGNPIPGETTTLYENDRVTVNNTTKDGKNILTDVKLVTEKETIDGKEIEKQKVIAEFDPEYRLRPDYKYTLSFNIKTKPTAYEEYSKTENGNILGYKGEAGDRGTDYPGNSTSSEQAGFHSNEEANVTYEIDGESKTNEYEHPVVQVATCNVKVMKQWLDHDGNPVEGTVHYSEVKFDLYQNAYTGTGSEKKLVEGYPKLYKAGYTLSAGSETPWKTVIKGLPLKGKVGEQDVYYEYVAKEVEVPGYMVTDEITSEKDTEDKSVTNTTIILKNQPGYELPETGGPGIFTYTIGGLLLMMIAAGMLLLYKKTNAERRM